MIKGLLAVFLAWSTVLVFAADTSDQEIEHLLTFVAASDCNFERNGDQHTTVEASDHMRMKLDRGGLWIDSPEDFIKHAATGSSISGKPYYVTCDQNKITSSQWLHTELQRFRNHH